MRKALRNYSELRPLRPDFGATNAPPSLKEDNQRLRAQLKAERVRHGRIEAALSRYQQLLEQQLQAQTQALEELRTALLTNLSQNLIGSGR